MNAFCKEKVSCQGNDNPLAGFSSLARDEGNELAADRFCRASISCEGSDYPVSNFSSETPDVDLYIGWKFRNDPQPLGTSWTHSWCFGVCTSAVSQDEADRCADAHAAECTTTQPGGQDPTSGDGGGGPSDDIPTTGPTGPPGPGPAKGNEPQTASLACPDGCGSCTYTVPAGTFFDRSQEVANQAAMQLAEKRAHEKYLCAPNLSGDYCKDTQLGAPVTISGNNPSFTISVAGGPPEMSVDMIDTYDAWVSGKLATLGKYTATVTVTDSKGNTATCPSVIKVMGVTNMSSMTVAHKGQAYSFQLEAKGGTSPYSWMATGLPTGLICSAGGLISGTPSSDPGSFHVIVSVTDADGLSCGDEGTLTELSGGPTFLTASPLPNATECVFYSQQITVDEGGCTFVGSGFPAGLSISSSGLISGVPTQDGSFTLHITATDTYAQSASKDYALTVLSDGTDVARSVADLKWTENMANHSDQGGSYVSGAPVSGGQFAITCTVPKNSGGGTFRRQWTAKLGRCAAQAAYNVTFSAVATFTRGGGAGTFQASTLALMAQTVYSSSGITGWIGSATDQPPVTPASPNLVIDLQIAGDSGPDADTVYVVTVNITPITPP